MRNLLLFVMALCALPLVGQQAYPGTPPAMAAFVTTTGNIAGPWNPYTGSGASGTQAYSGTPGAAAMYYSSTGNINGPWYPCTLALCFGGASGGPYLPLAGGTMTGAILGKIGTPAAPGYAFAGLAGYGLNLRASSVLEESLNGVATTQTAGGDFVIGGTTTPQLAFAPGDVSTTAADTFIYRLGVNALTFSGNLNMTAGQTFAFDTAAVGSQWGFTQTGAAGAATFALAHAGVAAALNWDASGNMTDNQNLIVTGTATHNGATVLNGTTTLNGKLTGSGHVTTQPNSGANLCGSATLSGTNWSGSGLGPYTHTSGITALTSASCTALVAGQSYLLTYSMTAGGGGTVTPSFGGLSGSAQSTTATFTQYGTATGTTAVAFTPTTGFTGTVTLVSMVAQGPKATSCGTPVIVQGSTDYAGKLTTAVSGCVVTFQTAYTNAPSCHFTPDTAISTDPSQAVTNTTLTVTATGMTAFDYECIGLNE